MLRFLEGLLGRRHTEIVPCGACKFAAEEIAWLREQNGQLLDRLMAAANLIEATRSALAAAEAVEPQRPQGEPEDAATLSDEVQNESLKQQRAWAGEHGQPLESTFDV